jgi:hypothetical protein
MPNISREKIEQKQIAAGRTLEKLGYTWQGGELWKPPLGANPSPLLTRITQLQTEVEALEREKQVSAMEYLALEGQCREHLDKIEAPRTDSARLDWIIDNASSRGGGNGFTLQVFIPVDCECVRTAIDTAIAKNTQALQEPK